MILRRLLLPTAMTSLTVRRETNPRITMKTDTAKHYLLQMCGAIRHFTHFVQIGDCDVVPKLYFEFTDMSKMYRAHAAIEQAFRDDVMFRTGEPVKREIDRDAIEIQIGGVVIVLRCLQRMTNLQGTDVGYTAVKFVSRSLP
jgi:hypothetical protein